MYSMVTVVIDNKKCRVCVPYGYNPALKPSEVVKVIALLENYVREHTDKEIELYNAKKKAENEAYYQDLQKQAKQPKPRANKGYVYLLECGGKYKIGYSKDVERRVRQLDTRPFKINVVSKIYSDYAYDIEQSLHAGCLYRYKVTGEWYEFDFKITPGIFEKWVKEQEEYFGS